MLHYDYSDARKALAAMGVQMNEDMLKQADDEFHYLALVEYEANRLVVLHAHFVKHLFNPKAYSAWGRVKLALWFLFGKYKG